MKFKIGPDDDSSLKGHVMTFDPEANMNVRVKLYGNPFNILRHFAKNKPKKPQNVNLMVVVNTKLRDHKCQ